MKSLISINDYNKEEMLQVLDLASAYEANPNSLSSGTKSLPAFSLSRPHAPV
jgi:ornithine carbamoyltransferase